MKKLILVLILFITTCYQAQNYYRIEDFKKELAKTKSDTARVDLLNAIGFHYFETNSDSALYFTEQALRLTKEINYLKGEARSLMNLGLVFRNLGNFPRSLEMQFKSLQICEQIGNKQEMASAYTNIAFSYSEHGDYEQAITYQQKALEIDKELELHEYLVIDYHNLGDGYEKLGKLDSALHFENKAYELALQNNYDDYLSAVLVNLGNIHFKLGNYDIALPFLRKSSYYGKKLNNYIDVCYSYFGMIDLFNKTGQKDSSIFYASKAFNEAQKGNLSLEMFTASTHLSKLYENKNRDSTLKYLKLSVALKDSMFNQEKIKQLQNLTFAERLRQQEIAEAKALEDLNQKKALHMYAIAIFVVIFIGLLFLFSRLKTNIRVLEWLGILTLLLTFNFIGMLIHSALKTSSYLPFFSFIVIAIISLILRPINHKVSDWMKEKLIKKNKSLIVDVKPVEQNQQPVIIKPGDS